MSRRRLTSCFACALAAASLIAGCGGDSDSAGPSTEDVSSRPAPPKSDFPSSNGRTLAEVLASAKGPAPVVSPASMVFYKGENRYSFGVFNLDGTPVSDAGVALYIAKVPPVKADGSASKNGTEPKGAAAQALNEALDSPAMGPYPAAIESMVTKPAFRAQTTAADENAPPVVYVADIDFPSDGEWRIVALVKEDGELRGTLVPSALVGKVSGVPRVGERAPVIHTPTVADAGGDLSKITTRIPPDTQNKVDFADVLGKEPIVLLFATPQFCESRVCGPVTDVAEQVKETYGDKAAFVHMEIFNDNDPANGVRPEVRAFGLPSEPWLFVIDRDGVVQTAIEGAFGVDRLVRAVRGVTEE
ncbi:MAG TPA: hypothetical protein VIE64_04040 [Solirubrobacterales bacterium]